MKVSIEIVGDLVKMDYEFGQGKYHSEHKFWPDDFILLLAMIQRIRDRTSTAEQKLSNIKRIVELGLLLETRSQTFACDLGYGRCVRAN